jgi:type I restriction enzyme S subunit
MLREICEERERRIRAGEVRRVSALQLTEDELGLDQPIPSNWEVCFIDKIAIKVTDGEHATPERCQSGRFLLSARNVTNTGIDLSDVDFVPESEYLRIRKRCDPDRGDIICVHLSCRLYITMTYNGPRFLDRWIR